MMNKAPCNASVTRVITISYINDFAGSFLSTLYSVFGKRLMVLITHEVAI